MDYLPELGLVLWCIAGYIWELNLKNTGIGLILCYIGLALRKIPKFHLISWRGNFEERHSFGIVLEESPETMQKLCLSSKFPHQDIRWNFGILHSVGLEKHLDYVTGLDLFYHTLAMDWLYYWKRDAVGKVWKFSWIINNEIAKV